MRKPTFLKRSIALLSLLCAAPFASANFTISNGQILDPNGNPFVFRGVAIRNDLAPEQTLQSLKDIAAAGANSALIELAPLPNGGHLNTIERQELIEWLKKLVETCRENKLVCVLEPNWNSPTNGQMLHYIFSIGVEVLRNAQDVIVLSVGNRTQGHFPLSYEDYEIRINGHINETNGAQPTIKGGYLLMVDGSQLGQDPNKDMLTLAKKNKAAGINNVIYSVDMFDAYTSPAAVRDYMESFAQAGIPLVVGGFATTTYRNPNDRTPLPPVSPLPAAAVMQYAQQFGFGYFAWQWGTNEANPLNLVQNWNPLTPTSWGQLALNDVNGIKATAKTATHFFNPSSSASSSSVRSSSTSSSVSSVNPNAPVIALNTNVDYIRCGIVNGVAAADGTTDPNGDTLTYAWEVTTTGGFRQEFTGLSIRFGMRPVTQYFIKLTVTDSTGLSSTKTTNLYHSYSDDCARSSSSSSSSVSSSSSSVPAAKATCTYNINSQWSSGFTGSMRVKNVSNQPISGWTVSWQYADSTKVTNAWNATLSGANPYQAKNEGWNSTIQPGQTVEFGFQGSKPAGAAITPTIIGGVCK